MRRLFPSFLTGWPAVGLLLLRVAIAAEVLTRPAASIVERGVALLLLTGFWTPLSGVSLALLGLAQFATGGTSRESALVAVVGVALAFIGPGLYSIDAWLFGWRHISIPPPRKSDGAP